MVDNSDFVFMESFLDYAKRNGMLIEKPKTSMPKKEKKIIVKGCTICPFIRTNEFDDFNCAIDEDEREIKKDGRLMPITPYWCDLKMNNVTIIEATKN